MSSASPHDIEETLQPIPESARTSRVSGQFWIWMGANIAPINWVLGALGISMGLSLLDTMLVLVIGNLIGMGLFGIFVLFGQKTGVTGMLLGRAVFGRRGNYLPSVIQAVVVIGWCAVNTWIVLDLVTALLGELGWLDPTQANIGWKIGIAALIMAIQVGVALAGYKAIAAFERWTVPPTVLVLVIMSIVAWFFLDIDWGYAGPAGAQLAGGDRIVAMSAVMTAIGIGWGITWLTYAADYSRFISTSVPRRKLYLASALGQFIPVIWLGLLGASLATKNGTVDPGQLIVENFGALAIPVLLLVLHGPIATNVLNIYSFSVAAQALDLKVGRKALNILVGVLSLAAAVFFIFQEDAAQTLDAWLVGVVGWVATWGAIMLVHYGIFERRSRRFDHLFDAVGSKRLPDVNPRALIAFFVGIVFTWLFLNGMVPALQGLGSQALGGLDISWLTGGVAAGLTYWLLARTSHRRWVEAQQFAATPEPRETVSAR
ncbi:cytosine permease [Microbacterium sp. BG28]|uniref:purine-cytosine permease family protein n=1 Tax=Microbacterium sp. BG28 TaxID=3097356 RepID=UPI002A5A578E|nr:cytosine permease [Microbacterium sp. BG28]MDY0827767.1 cytosine permease [Microbacterium sp. BG28]